MRGSVEDRTAAAPPSINAFGRPVGDATSSRSGLGRDFRTPPLEHGVEITDPTPEAPYVRP
jgi:hypothetical protein